MNIQKNNSFYDKEFTNDIEDYEFSSSFLDNTPISINNMKSQSELDITLSIDSIGKTKIELKIPI